MNKLESGIPGVRTLQEVSARMLYSLDQGEVPKSLMNQAVKRLADAVAQPKTVEEIRKVFAYADEWRIPVVPRGSASSAYGGVLPAEGGIMLDLTWLREVLEIDPDRRTARVQTGVRWTDLEKALESHNLSLRSYPTNCFSTVGGWIATGGYGIGSTRYGHLRETVESLRVVLPNGDERALRNGAEFEAFFGSDGQLGVVTEITLKVRETPPFRKPMLAVCETPADAFGFLKRVFERGAKPYFGNYWTGPRMKEKNHLMEREDFEEKPTVVLMIESEEDEKIVRDEAPRLEEDWKARLCWEDRFFPIRAKKLGPGLLAAELTFRLADVPAYIERAEELGRAFNFEVVAECQIVGPETGVAIVTFLYDNRNARAHFRASTFAMKLAVTALRAGATPYNLGTWYTPFAEKKYGDRYGALKALKRRLDPKGILNPGKSLSRPFFLTFLVKAYSWFNILPFWFKNPVPPAHTAPEKHDAENSLDVCSKCAACVAYCPAVLTVGDERVSARGKLFMARWTREGLLPEAEAKLVNLCMHCKYCTEVCQSDIALEDAFFDLEAKAGKDEVRVAKFLENVERSGVMERLPMCKPDPAWVKDKLHYDETSGSISYSR